MSLLRASVMAIALSGCTYITPKVYEDKIACLDEDHDGAVAQAGCADLAQGEQADCDEDRNDRFPGNTEVAYDGIDQDCSEADLIDVDGDGWPGILEADWAAAHPGIDYPTDLDCEGACDAGDLDCDDGEVGDAQAALDASATIFPGSAADVSYDGIDSDCAGDDDWDFDKDGHVPPDSVHDGVPYTGSLPQDDCDDTRADVYPGAAITLDPESPFFRDADVFYDGIDNNCDQVNDFDKDGDDYIENSRINAYLAYLAFYEYADTRAPCTGNCNDCDDNPDNDGGQVKTAFEINPGATETYYDALDQNCDALDDFDQDLDTFSCDGVNDLACAGHVGTDCDDDDETINPSALELVGDAVDQDCSGDEDAPRFQFGDLLWVGPTPPEVGRTDEVYVIAATADHFGATDSGPASPAIVITHAQAAGGGDFDHVFLFEPAVQDNVLPIGRNVALFSEPTVVTCATSAYDATPVKQTSLRVRKYDFVTGNPLIEQLPTTQTESVIDPGNSSTDPDPYEDFDLVKSSNGKMWGAACSLETVHFTVAINDPAVGQFASNFPADESVDGGGTECWLQLTSATAGTLHAYESGVPYRQFTLNGTPGSESITQVLTPSHATSALDPVEVRHRGRWVVFSRTGTLGVSVFDLNDSSLDSGILNGETVLSADLAEVTGGFVLAAITQETGEDQVLLCQSDALQTLEGANCVQIPFDDAQNSEPRGVGLYADDDMILIAVSAHSTGAIDALGWAFLGQAPTP